MTDPIPPVLKKIAERQGWKFWYFRQKLLVKFCDPEDLAQTVYERFWKDGLWESEDERLLNVVATRACTDWCRSVISGYRIGESFCPVDNEHNGFDIIEHEKAMADIFTDKQFEIASLRQLCRNVRPVEKMIINSLLVGGTQVKIARQVELTEGRISQIRTALFDRLAKLYAADDRRVGAYV